MKTKKIFKRLVSCFLVVSLCVLEIFPSSKVASDDNDPPYDFSANGISIRFGGPNWEGGTYCQFTGLNLKTEGTSIKTIQISYSGNDTEDSNTGNDTEDSNTEIVLPEQIGFTASQDNTKLFKMITTTAETSSIQTYLRGVKYFCNHSQSVNILLSSGSLDKDTHYFPGTGHFYKYVPCQGISWIDAYKAALAAEPCMGYKGYLAVITSKEEDDFYKKYAATDNKVPHGWLGGTCYKVSNMNTANATIDTNTRMGYWYWACGPESVYKHDNSEWSTSTLIGKDNIPAGSYGENANSENSIFYGRNSGKDQNGNYTTDGTLTNKTVRYDYSPWNRKGENGEEPNNSNAKEGCLCISSDDGNWNDLPNGSDSGSSAAAGYTVEYGDRLWGNSEPLEGSVIASKDIGKPVTINYNYNHVDLKQEEQIPSAKVYYNTKISDSIENLAVPSAPQGYTFLGWYTAVGDNVIKVTKDSNVADLLSGYSDSLNLYAKWSLHVGQLDLTSDNSSGSVPSGSGITINGDATLTLTVDNPHESETIRTEVDEDSYQISLDGGQNFGDATKTILGVTVEERDKSKLKFKITEEKSYELKIKFNDLDNMEYSNPVFNLTIDKTAPGTSDLKIDPSVNGYSNTKTPTLSGKGEAGCTITVKEGDTELGTTIVQSDNSWSVVLSPLLDGEHNLTVYQTDAVSNTSEISYTLEIDTTTPTGKITISKGDYSKTFNAFSSTIEDRYFFKNNVTVKFEGEDVNGSGLKSLAYLERTEEFSSENDDAIKEAYWNPTGSGNSISIQLNNRETSKEIIIYARITDNAGNVKIINSGKVVLYRDISVTTEENISYTRTVQTDLEVPVQLNGNTIKSISISSNNLTSATIDNSYYYTNSIDKKTYISYSYLMENTLEGGYTLKIDYNPAGKTFTEGESPAQHQIELTVKKQVQDDITITGINSDNKYTYGDIFELGTEGGSGEGQVTYSSSDPSVAKIEDNKVTILKVGKFKITAEKAADLDYHPNTVTSDEITVDPKPVTIKNMKADNKVYDGNINATINSTEAYIDGKLENDDLRIKNGTAKFKDKNVGDSKEVTFSGFDLEGNKATNYSLGGLQPEPSKANITPQELTIDLEIKNKQYDGLDTAEYESGPSLSGLLVEGDKVTLNKGIPTFENVNVGNKINIKFTEFSIDGDDKDNYKLIQPTGITANIYNKFEPEENEHYKIEGTKGSNDWYISSDFNVVSKDSEKYLISKSNTSDGPWATSLAYSEDTNGKDITFYVKDKSNGAISNPVTINYKKDFANPMGIIKIGVNAFRTFLSNITFGIFFKETVDVKIEPSDSLSGISKIEYYKTSEIINEDDIKNITSWTEGSEFSVSPDEKFIVYAKVTDNAGKVGYFSSDGIVVAEKQVQITANANFDTEQWTSKTDAQIEVNVKHDLPILDEINYQVNGGDLISVTEKINDNKTEANFFITDLLDGEYNVIINSKDKLGNIVQKIIPIKKDVIGPTMNSVAASTNDYTNGEVIVTVEATDETSKLAQKAYSFDNGDTWQEEKTKSYPANTKIESGTIKVKDIFGNISSYDQVIEINNIDKLPPRKPRIEGASQDWKNEDITLTVIAEDAASDLDNAQSDIDYFEYSVDGGNTFKKVKWEDSHQFKVAANGDYTEKIVVRVTDKAGNTSELSDRYTVKLNKEKPEIDSVRLDNYEWTNQNVKVIVIAHDDISGLSEQAYSFDDGKSWQAENEKVFDENCTVKVKVKNASGNISSYDDVIISNIDKLPQNEPDIESYSQNLKSENVTLQVIPNDKEADRTEKALGLSDSYSEKLDEEVKLYPFKQVDERTSIIMEAPDGVFPKDSKLLIQTIDDRRSQEYQDFIKLLDNEVKSNLENIRLFEIHVTDEEGNYIQPDTTYGLVNVRIPIPPEFNRENLSLWRLASDSENKKFDFNIVEVDNKAYCEFQTDHFSLYALVELKSNNFNWYLLIVMILIVGLFIFLVYKYYYKGKN